MLKWGFLMEMGQIFLSFLFLLCTIFSLQVAMFEEHGFYVAKYVEIMLKKTNKN
jgi:hypothetical protein